MRRQPTGISEGVFNSNEALSCISSYAGLRPCPDRRRPNTVRSRAPLPPPLRLPPVRPRSLSLLSRWLSHKPTRASATSPTCRESTNPSSTQLKALSDEVDNLTKQLQTQGDKLSDAERASRAKTIDDKKKQLERSAEDAQNDFQNEMQELYNGLASKVYDVLSDYAQAAWIHPGSRRGAAAESGALRHRFHQHHQGDH